MRQRRRVIRLLEALDVVCGDAVVVRMAGDLPNVSDTQRRAARDAALKPQFDRRRVARDRRTRNHEWRCPRREAKLGRGCHRSECVTPGRRRLGGEG